MTILEIGLAYNAITQVLDDSTYKAIKPHLDKLATNHVQLLNENIKLKKESDISEVMLDARTNLMREIRNLKHSINYDTEEDVCYDTVRLSSVIGLVDKYVK